MSGHDMPLEELLKHLDSLANASLNLWELPEGARARLINVSENATYLVEASGGYKSILRVHRENYHSRRAIECELEWIAALAKADAVITPGHYLGRNGQAIQVGRSKELANPRYMVLFHFVEGSEPDETGDLVGPFEDLGEIAARTHIHSVSWQRPADFERLTWDVDAVFGDNPTWGNWRDGPKVDAGVRNVLEQVEATVKRRLADFGQSPDRYGLIHADMRLANLLIDDGSTRLIDFDDCGFGWFLYDFATGISFMEDDPRVPELKAAWVRGYRKIRPLSDAEEAEIDTFVMLRRLALLAWIGSHIEAPEPQALAPDFARVTAELGAVYLKAFS
ncbi:serine/threonine protein kinase [Roseovarius litorisediminis]|uniref:Serine/threonine protein kinase n=1 Tax=Roseovarius litorisediminis TaxID=1312363 RepID=A0A1Y5SVV6_9RHOB|nr:phosphotransferase [Roseovarius litorisediminis]SLN49520.1 serine/threonine protein kinase [Roseovarius litorisediminis]